MKAKFTERVDTQSSDLNNSMEEEVMVVNKKKIKKTVSPYLILYIMSNKSLTYQFLDIKEKQVSVVFLLQNFRKLFQKE